MKNQIFKVLVLQYVLGFIYLTATGIWDAAAMMSAATGCMAALVPKTYLCMRMLRAIEVESAAQWLGYAYRSQIGKWVIAGAIFMLAFTTDYPWDPVVLFAGFVLIETSGWLAAVVIKGN